MKKGSIPMIGAVITALLSTLCCLPAFLFIFFGITSGVFTYFTSLEYTRIPLAILAIVFFYFGFRNYKKKISCNCSKRDLIINTLFLLGSFILLLSLLLYPEVLPYLLD